MTPPTAKLSQIARHDDRQSARHAAATAVWQEELCRRPSLPFRLLGQAWGHVDGAGEELQEGHGGLHEAGQEVNGRLNETGQKVYGRLDETWTEVNG